MKRTNTMSTITVELIIKMKTKFTSSNAENIQWIHLTTDVRDLLTDVIFSHLSCHLCLFCAEKTERPLAHSKQFGLNRICPCLRWRASSLSSPPDTAATEKSWVLLTVKSDMHTTPNIWVQTNPRTIFFCGRRHYLSTGHHKNEPKDNWQNKHHQESAFQASHETNQKLLDLVWISIPGCLYSNLGEIFFFRPTPCGFRQVVQQLSKTVANKINYLIRTGAVAVVAAKVSWKRTDT